MYKEEKYSKYEYIQTKAWQVRLIFGLGILTWALAIVGYISFLNLNPLYWLVIGPLIAIFSLYYFISYGIDLFYRSFDLSKHKQLVSDFWDKTKKYPTVDIFLPICGEDNDLLKKSFAAVSRIEYPFKKVHVLDDQGNTDHKKLAKDFGFTYLSRENKGYMKKAGNLKHGYDNSNSDFIAVFDADFAPNKNFLTETLPYMQDEKIGLIQTPQYFETTKDVHDRSIVEFGSGYTQEIFYHIIQVARDYFHGAICCGTNVLYRRKALEEIGGPVLVDHSEDVHTGFDLMNKGWRTKYLPVILAIGLCPANIHAYFHQQYRWTNGSLTLAASKKFWASKISIGTKLCFISGYLFYIANALSIFLFLIAFVVIIFHYDYINVAHALPFIPYIIWSFLILPLFRITKPRYGTYINRMAQVFTHSYTVFVRITNFYIEWVPTGGRIKKASNGYLSFLFFTAIYFVIYTALLGIVIGSNHFTITNYKYHTVLFWLSWNFIILCILLFHLSEMVDRFKKEEVRENKLPMRKLYAWRLKTFLPLVVGAIFILGFSWSYSLKHPIHISAVAKINTGVSTVTLASNIEAKIYVVQEGDSLWKISEKKLASAYRWKDVAERNHISSPDLIFPGQKIQLN